MQKGAGNVIGAAPLLGVLDKGIADGSQFRTGGSGLGDLVGVHIASEAVGGEKQKVVGLESGREQVRLDMFRHADGPRDDRLQVGGGGHFGGHVAAAHFFIEQRVVKRD